jgi:hypothetical protein
MFPAPGVYDGDTILLEAMSVVQLIRPSNVDVAQCTLSALAVISTVALAVI